MTSNRPYLIRAIYDWLVDNGLTPHLLVNTEVPRVSVPADYIEGNRIVLNVSPSAVAGLELGNEMIFFNARFGGKSVDLSIPVEAVLGVYARENGQGMIFPDEAPSPEDPDDPDSTPSKPTLKVVK